MLHFRLSAAVAAAMLSLGISACGGGGGSASPTPVGSTAAGPTTVNLDLRQAFTDTKLAVSAGEKLTITTTGTVNNGQCGATSCAFGPGGAAWSTCQNDPPPAFVAPGLACYSLIGKIGPNGAPFEVGAALQLTIPTAGELYLGLNDNYFPDNTGSWVSSIATST